MTIIWAVLIGVIYFGIVWQIIDACLGGLWFGTQSKNWIPVQAKITGYSVGLRTTYRKDTTVTSWGYEVKYSYDVSGITYQSSGFNARGFETFAHAEIAATRLYPIGQDVEIAYNPKNPQINSSDIGLSCSSILLYLTGLFMGSGLLVSGINVILPSIVNLSNKRLLFDLSLYIARLGVVGLIPIFYASFILIADTFQRLIVGLQNSHPGRKYTWLARLIISFSSCISTVVAAAIAFQSPIVLGLVLLLTLYIPFIMIVLAFITDCLISRSSALKHENGSLDRRGHWLFNLIVGCLNFFLSTALSVFLLQYPFVRVDAI
ncbi:MAG: DUF3592 domain-containing protein [Methylacidiphilales bacterium]|nr:DUF3592 domain-containing protein [Candidatus Methylacidiphilales bacterium]NJR16501.1 DUF3592 domain-containing protein [Calothrix sp. CSU_2_0]